jgi:hypothetical protein
MSKPTVEGIIYAVWGFITAGGVGLVILQGIGALLLGGLGAIGGWYANKFIIPRLNRIFRK